MIGRIAEFLLFGMAPMVLATLVAPAASMAEERSVTGEVLYRERIALPPNAVVTVELADVSLADAPAAIVGEQKIDQPGQVPVAFSITFDSSVIRTGTAYALQARITVDDQLWFVNDTRHEVDPLGSEKQTLVLKMVR